MYFFLLRSAFFNFRNRSKTQALSSLPCLGNKVYSSERCGFAARLDCENPTFLCEVQGLPGGRDLYLTQLFSRINSTRVNRGMPILAFILNLALITGVRNPCNIRSRGSPIFWFSMFQGQEFFLHSLTKKLRDHLRQRCCGGEGEFFSYAIDTTFQPILRKFCEAKFPTKLKTKYKSIKEQSSKKC